ncbi:U32 family peptidase [Methanoregula sp. UBA64]|jgi:U32 family peptidase|uniref:U32 family peptidase n=1 Tax=Methanoregula sp. UBA64 TaxID=1915554 RepID=UPI0025EF336C|nr:U32 family peptidase [Methanoregula sp. UBA64]
MSESRNTIPTKKIPELLAPAGSPEAFRAAVAAGADAIYLSGKHFGARRFAKNFSDDEMAAAIAYAHARGVRVYVTVNTLIHDRELDGVAAYLVRLYAMGADAVLVQDPGIAALAREIVPGLALHASTQLTIHNADGVRWAYGQGFSRVVLARELSLAEIGRIAEETRDLPVGLEVFAHGALCYSYSGQCLLSSVIGGRSGNRGMCAQPCRKRYTLVEGKTDKYGRPTDLGDVPTKEHYLLSPKDLWTYRDIGTLAGSPVASLKIEGRMKSAEYVAIVVSTYRRALDAAAAGTFTPDASVERDLYLAFNREFTKGYLMGDRLRDLMGRERPDNRGLCIGKVACFDQRRRTVTIVPDRPITLHPGDGILFSSHEHPAAAWGCALNSEPVVTKEGIEMTVARPVIEGTLVYLTSSLDLAARARQIAGSSSPDLSHPVPVDLAVRVDAEGLLTMTGTICPPGRSPVMVEGTPGPRMEPARSRPLTPEQLAEQLTKTGGTPFAVANLSLEYDGTRFAPVSGINQMRRDFFARAEAELVAVSRPVPAEVRAAEQRLKHYTSRLRETPTTPAGNARHSCGIVLFADTLEAVEAGAGAGTAAICFEPAGFPCRDQKNDEDGLIRTEAALRAALTVCRKKHSRLIWKLPRITRETEMEGLRILIPRLLTVGLDACMVDNPGTAAAISALAPEIGLAGSFGLNVFNAETVRAFSRQGFGWLLLSPELSGDECALLIKTVQNDPARPQLGIFVQGSLETMVTEDCLHAILTSCRKRSGSCARSRWIGVRDETGHLLPVRTDGACRSHIFNAAETSLIEALPELAAMGVDALVIDARGRPGAYAQEMVKIYREALAPDEKSRKKGAGSRKTPKERIREIALGGITTGHYTRGVKEE